MSDEEEKVTGNAEYENADGEPGPEGPALATVGADPEEGEYENKEIRQKILAILAETEDSTWALAVILETAYDQDMYLTWGFTSFKDYVANELGMHIRRAQYLVQLQEWFKKMPANIQKWVRGLGWTKARMLMHAVTVENAAEWKNKVAGKSVTEIDEMLKAAKAGEVGGGGGEGGEDQGEKPLNKNFKLFPLQLENIDRALEKAGEISGSEKPGNNIDLICTEYLATNAGVDSIQDLLRKMEKMLGVRLVAYVPEDKSVAYGSDLIAQLAEEADAEAQPAAKKDSKEDSEG